MCDITHRYLQKPGWGKKYDEVITPEKIVPAFSKVRRTRGWVKLDHSLPHWPCVIFLRTGKSAVGVESLELEPKVFVMPFGDLTHHRLLKPFS